MTRQEIYENTKKYTLFTWTAQAGYDPIVVDKVDGVCFWDVDGTRYMDLTSQLICVNAGFGKQEILDAIKEQIDKFPYVAPRHTYEKRAELGKIIIEEIAPKNMGKVLFGLGGADANEFAIRLAKVCTGRNKVFAKYQSYHGSTYGSGSLTGEADRSVPFAPMPGVIHFDAPHTYTYDIQFACQEEATAHFLNRLEYQMKMEDPKDIAALFIETVPGSNGVYVYPEGYLKGVRELCTKYGILMVCDEVMAGFGRCGEWFACQAYDVVPDIITCAKGLSSAYAPLSGVILSKEICDYYDKAPLPAGLTYNAHALGVAAGVATSIIALGGGSAMDTAKAAGIIHKYGGEIGQYEGGNTVPGPIDPLIAIATTAGTGSEVSTFSVIVDEARNYKLTINDIKLAPTIALLDPELIMTAPPSIAAACGMDAFIHAMESYTNNAENVFAEALAEKAMELIGGYIRRFVAVRTDEEAACAMMLGSTFAGITMMTRLGNVHAMSHPVSAYFGVAHGVANAILLPTVTEYNALGDKKGKFAKIYQYITGEPAPAGFKPVMLAQTLRALNAELGIPACLADVGVTEDKIPVMAADAMKSGNILVNPRTARQADIEALYHKAMYAK